MNGAPTSSMFGAQAEQQTQNGTHRKSRSQGRVVRRSRVVPTVGQKSGSRISHAKRARDLWNGREHQRGETERGQLPDTQQQAHAQGAAEPEGRLYPA